MLAVEDTVPERVEPKVLNGVDWIPARQHVMPLQDLVQNDAIEKSSEAKSEKDARANRECRCPEALLTVVAAVVACFQSSSSSDSENRTNGTCRRVRPLG